MFFTVIFICVPVAAFPKYVLLILIDRTAQPRSFTAMCVCIACKTITSNEVSIVMFTHKSVKYIVVLYIAYGMILSM